MNEIHAVTGAFGYSGRYIAQRLLERGHGVVTLTNSPHRKSGLPRSIRAVPLDFGEPNRLVESLHGVSVLYNTYWVRFNHRHFDHQGAVKDSRILFEAARTAGVQRIVHVSITNPSLDSPLSYFRGKAQVESALQESGVGHSILRPAVLFGKEDILVNNIAWALRRFPFFGVFGDGSYRLCPIHVGDLAEAAVEHGLKTSNIVVDAIGPETFSYKDLVTAIAEIIGVNRPIVGVPDRVGWLVGRAAGALFGDVMITMDEIRGLSSGLLYVESEPLGSTRLTDWGQRHRESLGQRYTSELKRRSDRVRAYQSN